MYLTPEQREIGKLNFLTALGGIRKEFLEKSLEVPKERIGSYYFGYGSLDGEPVRAGIVGTGNEGCGAMIVQSSPEYLRFVGYHDIRPSQIARAEKVLKKSYGSEQGGAVKFHRRWEDMLADEEIEAIVVATPLWTHARLAIEAMQAGKHVFCEKLMAHNITDAKAMVQAAHENDRILGIGHQRHYSTLYDNALAVIEAGVLGKIRHIRCLWHRNNSVKDGWSPEIPDEDRFVDFGKYGYKSLKELIRWRLYNRTGGGLIAELGSHQLDACSLFLGKVHPIRAWGVGGTYYFTPERFGEDAWECEDHVYCTFEFPEPGGDPKVPKVIVTYSSITTNAHEGYGEIITGTEGTLMILNERDLMLFKEQAPGDESLAQDMHIQLAEGPKLESTPSLSLSKEAALAKLALEHASQMRTLTGKQMVNRGYHEELEAFGFAVRNPDRKDVVRCNGEVALADAVMALGTNVAMRENRAIEFSRQWYDPSDEAVPDEVS